MDENIGDNTLICSAIMDKPEELSITLNPFGPSVNITIKVKGDHPSLGLGLKVYNDNTRIALVRCLPSTLSHLIQRWTSTLCERSIVIIFELFIPNLADVHDIIATARTHKSNAISVEFITKDFVNLHPGTNVPQIHLDQMNIMAYRHQAAINNIKSWENLHNTPPVTDNLICAAMDREKLKPRLIRDFLKKKLDWVDRSILEYKQLNQYHAQGMFDFPSCP